MAIALNVSDKHDQARLIAFYCAHCLKGFLLALAKEQQRVCVNCNGRLFQTSTPEGLRKQFATAWRKGYNARKEKLPFVCPYPDHRTARGAITFSRSFRQCWIAGWLTADAEANHETDTDTNQ